MLDGKVVLITGGASGIGEATARLASGYGARLALVDRDRDRLHAQAAAFPEGLLLEADITDAQAVNGAVAATVERFGRLDCAFNNAGVEQRGAGMFPVADYPLDDFDRLIGVNVRAQLLLLQAELAIMRAAGRGSIVFTASAMGLFGQPGMGAYVTSKHALVGLMKAAALDVARAGIRVNAIAPGAVRTPMLTERAFPANPGYEAMVGSTHALGRIAEPAEIGEAACWLMSDKASFVTGTVLAVDGGYGTS
jgi:NAD(P)-dependent dehydrogenase (short-subunit alcohol dehydrogenase family)